MCSIILTEVIGKVGVVRINRPDALNALNDAVMKGISDAIDSFESNDQIHCMILTGSDKVFAAGADISSMNNYSYMDAFKSNFITRNWERIKSARKPIIASVSGYALGGGCEIAMMCDIIFAADNAIFGQPEVRLGVLPGAGGTQRLPRAIGKAKAMDMCLTARNIDAFEAERSGLVSRVIAKDDLFGEVLKEAEKIASFSLPVVMMIKESINRAYESSLNEGLLFERRTFHAAFALKDQKEGMSAFLEKRKPAFVDA